MSRFQSKLFTSHLTTLKLEMELRVFEKERIRDEEVESVGHKGAIEWYQRIRQSTSALKPVSQPDNNARPFLTLELPLARGGASMRR